MKILIVEDDENSRLLLETTLVAHGYIVESASNGLEALELSESNPPNMIISDVLMPQMDGFELCRRIKSSPKLRDIVFIFYSATFIEDRDERLALALGAKHFIVKPIDMCNLLDIIKSSLDQTDTEPFKAALPDNSSNQVREGLYTEQLSTKLTEKIKELEWEHKILMQSEERYSSLVNDVLNDLPTAIIVFDNKYNVTWLNRSFEKYFNTQSDRITGMPAEHLYTKLLQKYFKEPATIIKITNSLADKKYLKNLECLLETGNPHTSQWLEYSSKPIESGLYKGGRMELFTDITHHKA